MSAVRFTNGKEVDHYDSYVYTDKPLKSFINGLSAMMLPSLPECAMIFKDFSFYLAPDAPHGVGLGTGTEGYVNAYTQIAQWPDMAVNFIESRIGLQEKTIDMDSVAFAW